MPRRCLAEARAQNRLPIFVGGSGLYFKALTRGLSAVPPIPAEVRDGVRARLERDGVEALHAELARRDPASAERLKPRDRTRIARALEVVEATGRALTDWHREGLPPLLPPGEFSALFLAPDREQLYARIDARFDAMLAAGRAGGGRGAGRATARSAAAGDEGPWRAGADPASARRDHARARPPKSAAPTPAITPSGSSPGSGISCRSSNGWRRRRRGGGWMRGLVARMSEAQSGRHACDRPRISLRSIRSTEGTRAWLEPANSHSPNARNPVTLPKSRLMRVLPLTSGDRAL